MNLLIKALSYAIFGEPKSETTQIATGGPHPDIMGVDDIKVGDRFYGYACGNFFENQICTNITKDDLIVGTTTLVVFKKCNILKY